MIVLPLLGTTTKQSAEVELFSIYYGEDIEPTDTFTVELTNIESLDSSVVGFPVIDAHLIDAVGQKVKLIISGGTPGGVYKVTVRIKTSSDRVLEDEFKIRIRDY